MAPAPGLAAPSAPATSGHGRGGRFPPRVGGHRVCNALDSAWLFDVRLDYRDPAHQPVRILAQGRDPSATIDSLLSGSPGFQNDGDDVTWEILPSPRAASALE